MKTSNIFFLFFILFLALYLYLTGNLLGLVVITGFLDGIHPCGFTVLLFFIAFMLNMKRSRKHILILGGLYILGVFIAYFSIGLGIMNTLSFFEPHLMAKIGAILLTMVGLISIKDGLHGTRTLKIPEFTKPYFSDLLGKGTMFTTLIAGLLVGLCAFPCVGGLYVAIITLLTANGVSWDFFGLLIIYNLMFVAPLIFVLWVSTEERVLEKIEEAEKNNRKIFKLMMGAFMILFGVYVLTREVM